MAKESGKREAQQHADRIAAFRQELDQLARDQVLVLAPEQRTRVDAHLDSVLADLAGRFDIDISSSQRQLSWGMRIVSTLGGLALCAAVFLFFYRIWGLISTPSQVVILIAAPLLALAVTEFVSRRERTPYFTALLALVALASFVLNLYVMGQIFNIASSPKAFLPWGAFAILLAYRHGLRLLLAAGLLALTVYISGIALTASGLWWEAFYSRPELWLLSGLIIAVAPAPLDRFTPQDRRNHDFAPVYRLVGLLLVFVSLLWLWNSGEDSYLPFDHKPIEVFYQILAFMAAALTIWIGIRRTWTGTVNLGAAAFTIFLFVKLEQWWWEWMPKYLFFLLIGLIAIGLLLIFRKLREELL